MKKWEIRTAFACILTGSLLAIHLIGCTGYYDPAGKPAEEAASDQSETSVNETEEDGSETSANETDEDEWLQMAESARIANPWGETQSLSVAEEWAELTFTPPAEEITLQNGKELKLTTYRYIEGTIEALYQAEDYELTVRKSADMEGTALAGDDTPYPSEREESVEGLTVHCLGDGESIRLAYYDAGDCHFSIAFRSGEEGLCEADLCELIKSIR
ncbi:MAG: hypothetical protein K6G83_09095 [Lachnospiraceae bacterium]|nr:hypothetical protein [Lachnospiraceae bacterium]